jgi:hypothetical protein
MLNRLTSAIGIALAIGATLAAQTGSIEQEVIKIDRAFDEATMKKDKAALERMLASEYFYIHSNGQTSDKATEIADSMQMNWTSSKLDDLKARSYGDVVIVTGVQTLTGSARGYVSGARRYTNIWVRRNNQWQIVGGQATLVPAK